MRFVIFLALLGCDKSKPADPSAIIGGDSVQLVSAGLEPARLLRYHLTKGETSSLELAMDLDLDAGGRGGVMPRLIMKLGVVIEDVLPTGDAKIKTTIESARVEQREGGKVPIAAVAQMTDMLSGITYTAELSPDGVLKNPKVDASKTTGLDAQIQQLTEGLEQVAIRMPAIPVGVGAKWTSRKDSKRNDLQMTTVTTIQITALDGDKVTFASTSTVTAPDQTVSQNGVTASIKDVGGGGSGSGTVDLSKMSMQGQVTAEFRGMMSSGSATAPLKMAMKMTLK